MSTEQAAKRTRHNKHKRTPILGLAHHIVWFNSKRRKQELAALTTRNACETKKQ